MGARFLQAYYDTPKPGPAWRHPARARTVGSSLVAGRFATRLFSPVEMELVVDGRVSPVREPGSWSPRPCAMWGSA